MGNCADCFKGYTGEREFKRLTKRKTKITQQLSVLAGEHEASIVANEARRTDLRMQQMELAEGIKAARNSHETVRLTRSEKQQVMTVLRERVAIERRLATAYARRDKVRTSNDHIHDALTHQVTTKVQQRIYQEIGRDTTLDLDTMETARDEVDDADEALGEMVSAMHERDTEAINGTDESEMMAALMGEFMQTLNSTRTYNLTQRDTALEMVENDDQMLHDMDGVEYQVPLDRGNRRPPMPPSDESYMLVDHTRHTEEELLLD